ncbi:MAG: AMP-binding protein [Candidatus Eremiobacteraeota bacterium]|nr:AMP-binding protein [Candidatus Eremiobacteraeota bacterium]
MNVAELLDRQARDTPHALAIVEKHGGGRTTTFSELQERAAQGAALLLELGIRPNDGVLIVHPMQTQLYVALTAVLRIGAVAMFIDPSADTRILDACCALQQPVAYFSSPLGQLLRFRSRAVRAIELNICSGTVPGAIPWGRSLHMASSPSAFAVAPDGPALVTFTSGSTGVPKGAVRTHAVLLAQLEALRETMELQTGSVDLTTLPIVLLANLACGVTSVISDVDLRRPGRVDGAHAHEDAAACNVTSATASPAFFGRMLSCTGAAQTTLPRIRKIFCGGAPVFPRLLDELQNLAPHADPSAVYGSTEAEPIAHCRRSDITTADRKAMQNGAGLLAGMPVRAVRLRIIAEQSDQPISQLDEERFAQMTLPSPEAGEIVVSGDHVVPGYLAGRGDAETKFKVDTTVWHRTGDLGYLDASGRLWLLGRCGTRIDRDGQSLFPFCVETAVSDVPGVARSALVAVNGLTVLAVQPKVSDKDRLKGELQLRLGWARIDAIRFLHRIPVDRRHNAKIDYPALRRVLTK